MNDPNTIIVSIILPTEKWFKKLILHSKPLLKWMVVSYIKLTSTFSNLRQSLLFPHFHSAKGIRICNSFTRSETAVVIRLTWKDKNASSFTSDKQICRIFTYSRILNHRKSTSIKWLRILKKIITKKSISDLQKWLFKIFLKSIYKGMLINYVNSTLKG